MIINSADPSLSEIDYPAWCQDDQVPVTTTELREIFDELTERFGFQKSSKENMFHHLMAQLDSRASRSTAYTALLSLHVSYIGGEHSNFRKWYFAAQLDLDDEIGFQNMKLTGDSRKRNFKLAKKRGTSIKEQLNYWKEKETEFENNHPKISLSRDKLENGDNLKIADYKWKSNMKRLSPRQMARQIALYLLCWGEANQVRFAPECLCFIFKCAMDYDANLTATDSKQNLPEYTYLNDIITPLYTFLKMQLYKTNSNNECVKRENDHTDIIGYDDVNQLFWYPEGIESIILNDSQRLVDIPQVERYLHLKDVPWSKVFYKTYKEKRGWMHCFTNFNRFWLIHFTPFWIFTSFNSPTLYTKDYIQLLNNQPTYQVRLCVMAFGGTISCLIQIFATIFEWCVVPRRWPGAQHLSMRMTGLIFCLLINFCPSIYIFGFFDLNTHSKSGFIVAIVQFIISILTTLLFSIRPLGGFFGSYLNKDVKKRRYISSQTFTASFAKLTGRSKWFSIGLWIFVFLAKYLESYFFLTLSLRDPIRVLSTMDLSRCGGDSIFGKSLCLWQAQITLVLMLLCDLCLFFLDTYLWYIICNCIFSLVLSLSLGTSIFTPWKNIYSRLPKRIYSKIISTVEMNAKFKSKLLVSQIWNSIIISMYREHLLSIEHIQRLLYQQIDSTVIDSKTLRSPTFFVAQDDSTYKSMEFFPKNSEAKRRISFFAQSLSTPISEPIPVECMPSFTVIVPHYSEKIILGLKEIIKEESPTSRMTILEYLKHLHSAEWSYFVRDTKLLTIENDMKLKTNNINNNNNNIEITNLKFDNNDTNSNTFFQNVEHQDPEKLVQDKINELPLDLFGFKSSDTSYTLRTRLWASLRMQTLYRTISGFMNYSKAIKLLQRIENPSVLEYFGDDDDALENNLENVANRKFRMLVAMQRYVNFSPDEILDTEILLKSFPNIYISYLDIEKDVASNALIYYSCLTNGFADIDEVTGLRKPIFRIRLSGNPILGDGKSDNQNNAIIFYRGEYIQVVDANQDNYLEECLKIRSLLAEFDELDLESSIPYIPGIQYDEEPAPIAILGAREYIFSENIGVLGDIAAGKEQTFGTLFARTLAEIDGKLHYGHPDFINAIFMTTRGGLSKAQKGLHLNEDIYAGMNALCRGGRIKHSDYYQCGKGRDLGFSSILNFTTKIGAGMGEQLLSREEFKSDKSHQAWWNGKWYGTGLGWNIVLQPMREYVVKVMESSYFSADFFLGHFLLYFQTPLLFIPFIDYWHSIVLFWLKPRHVIWNNFVSELGQYLTDTPLELLIQPSRQINNDTGPNAPSSILRTTPKLIPFKTVG
ncbi:1,3-beta-glucan synthase component fks3 [Maudiozyma exigua]|uniref:1,3-beta-glucan synthase n=1 Tax=Maudiozyma exigua TaxID=34358 RepID=A0A9P6WBK7_MAUEX|nr:1,3-beta-glucan synthase component fks3 [Kazachstania exigua]